MQHKSVVISKMLLCFALLASLLTAGAAYALEAEWSKVHVQDRGDVQYVGGLLTVYNDDESAANDVMASFFAGGNGFAQVGVNAAKISAANGYLLEYNFGTLAPGELKRKYFWFLIPFCYNLVAVFNEYQAWAEIYGLCDDYYLE